MSVYNFFQVGLRVTTRRSSTTTSSGKNDPPINVYWRKDIEAKSIAVWGSPEALELEKERRLRQEEQANLYKMFLNRQRTQGGKFSRSSWPVRGLRSKEETGLQACHHYDFNTICICISKFFATSCLNQTPLNAWSLVYLYGTYPKAGYLTLICVSQGSNRTRRFWVCVVLSRV